MAARLALQQLPRNANPDSPAQPLVARRPSPAWWCLPQVRFQRNKLREIAFPRRKCPGMTKASDW